MVFAHVFAHMSSGTLSDIDKHQLIQEGEQNF